MADPELQCAESSSSSDDDSDNDTASLNAARFNPNNAVFFHGAGQRRRATAGPRPKRSQCDTRRDVTSLRIEHDGSSPSTSAVGSARQCDTRRNVASIRVSRSSSVSSSTSSISTVPSSPRVSSSATAVVNFMQHQPVMPQMTIFDLPEVLLNMAYSGGFINRAVDETTASGSNRPTESPSFD
ncbi:unnamed protein product, partial [Mesorhabditis spiculigera]